MRFIYCACAISHMLNDWSSVDKERVYHYILSSQVALPVQPKSRFLTNLQAYDGGIAQGPFQESHGTQFMVVLWHAVYSHFKRWIDLLCSLKLALTGQTA